MATSADAALDTAALRDVIARAARRLRQESGTGLTPSLAAAFGTIARAGRMTPSELAEAERIRRPAATRIIRLLEAQGLVERIADPSDGRSVLVSLTSAGHELIADARRRKDDVVARLLEGVGEEDRRVLARATEILNRMLGDA